MKTVPLYQLVAFSIDFEGSIAFRAKKQKQFLLSLKQWSVLRTQRKSFLKLLRMLLAITEEMRVENIKPIHKQQPLTDAEKFLIQLRKR